MPFTLIIDPRAVEDIQQAINYYDEQKLGLGKRFAAVLDQNFSLLEKNPFLRIRYDNVRCLPLKKFPYMVHFTVEPDRDVIVIRAVFHTSLNPKKWKGRK